MAYREYFHTPVTQGDIKWGFQQGLAAGIIAGLVFAVFEMLASAFMMGAGAFFMPLRMIGAIALGSQALDPGYSLWTAGFAGVVVHLVLAIIYGLIFGVVATMLRGAAALIGIGWIYGLALWLVNFYAIAPTTFPWFLDANPVLQFIAHTFFFGAVLGLWFWNAQQRSGFDAPTA
jgi:hypothetical protein